MPLALSLTLAAPGSAAKAKPSDDDLLNNIGASPAKPAAKPAPVHAPAEAAAVSPPPVAAPLPDKGAADKGAASVSPLGVIDRVKAVPRKELLKRHRLELSPYVGVSMNDPYFEHLEVGGSLIFYPHDSFGIGLGADYFFAHARTPNIDAVRLGLTSVLAQFDLPVLLAHLDMYWLPIYGKVSLFNSWIINFDLYASAGVGVATAFGNRQPIAANFAIGEHFALEQWVALRLEVRDHLFVDLQKANDIHRSSLQSYVMFLLGLSFYIPPTFEYSFQ